MFELLNAIGEQVNKEVMSKGGVLALCWEELNETSRKSSIYTEGQEELSASIKALNLGERLKIGFYEAGLCLESFNISEDEANKVCDILKNFMSEEDYESLEWDVCHPNGRMVW